MRCLVLCLRASHEYRPIYVKTVEEVSALDSSSTRMPGTWYVPATRMIRGLRNDRPGNLTLLTCMLAPQHCKRSYARRCYVLPPCPVMPLSPTIAYQVPGTVFLALTRYQAPGTTRYAAGMSYMLLDLQNVPVFGFRMPCLCVRKYKPGEPVTGRRWWAGPGLGWAGPAGSARPINF